MIIEVGLIVFFSGVCHMSLCKLGDNYGNNPVACQTIGSVLPVDAFLIWHVEFSPPRSIFPDVIYIRYFFFF